MCTWLWSLHMSLSCKWVLRPVYSSLEIFLLNDSGWVAAASVTLTAAAGCFHKCTGYNNDDSSNDRSVSNSSCLLAYLLQQSGCDINSRGVLHGWHLAFLMAPLFLSESTKGIFLSCVVLCQIEMIISITWPIQMMMSQNVYFGNWLRYWILLWWFIFSYFSLRNN